MKIVKSFSQHRYIVIDKIDDEYTLSTNYYQDISDDFISTVKERLSVYGDIFAAYINALPVGTTPEVHKKIASNFVQIINKYDVKVIQVDNKPVESNLGPVYVTHIAAGKISTIQNYCFVFQPTL
jgi:hypothetical protein